MASKNQKIDLLVIGELNMDLILDNVESFPELEKEKIARDMNLTLGSSSAIFASNIARFGIKTGFCGMIGNDNFGSGVIRVLQNFGIDTSLIITHKQQKTGLTVIIRQGDSRAMLTYPGAMAHFSLDDIPPKTFQTARHLHLSSIFLQPGIKRDLFKIINKAKSLGMTISVDPQWDPSEDWELDIEKLLQMVDFFLPNEAEFLHLTKSNSVKKGFKKIGTDYRACIVVKQGTNGATYIQDHQITTIPAFKNQHPVDAVGAGDSFDAGFIYQFLQGASTANCVKFGNLIGAVSTTQAGGTAAVSSLKEVQKIATEKFSFTDFDEITR